MIVMLALLNDGAILSIAYDNVTYRNQPEAWNMRLVLGIATVLGLVGPIASFGLFYLGDRIFHLGRPELQTMMYLMLSVAGHLTIFQTRTRGPWWSTRPAWILLAAVVGTQAVATLIAVYGAWLVTPLGWKYAGIVWGYAFAWFLVTDPVKLLAYKVLDTVKADSAPKPEANPDAKAETKPEAKAAPQADAKAEPKPEAMAAPQSEAKADSAKADATEPDSTKTSSAKPDAKSAPPPNAKADGVKAEPDSAKAGAAAPEAPKPTQAKPDAASGPQPEVKADNAAPGVPKAGVAKPGAAKAVELRPEVEAQTAAETNAGFTKLMNTTLGDVLLAGLAKDPRGVERIVAEAVTKAEAAPSRTRKRTKPKSSQSSSRTPSPSGKPKPSPSRHPKPSPRGRAGPARRAK